MIPPSDPPPELTQPKLFQTERTRILRIFRAFENYVVSYMMHQTVKYCIDEESDNYDDEDRKALYE